MKRPSTATLAPFIVLLAATGMCHAARDTVWQPVSQLVREDGAARQWRPLSQENTGGPFAFLSWDSSDSITNIAEAPEGPFGLFIHLRNLTSLVQLRYVIHFASADPIIIYVLSPDSLDFPNAFEPVGDDSNELGDYVHGESLILQYEDDLSACVAIEIPRGPTDSPSVRFRLSRIDVINEDGLKTVPMITGREITIAEGNDASFPPLVRAAHLPPVSEPIPQSQTWVSAVVDELEDPWGLAIGTPEDLLYWPDSVISSPPHVVARFNGASDLYEGLWLIVRSGHDRRDGVPLRSGSGLKSTETVWEIHPGGSDCGLSIQDCIDNEEVVDGDIFNIWPGTYSGRNSSPIDLYKALHLRAAVPDDPEQYPVMDGELTHACMKIQDLAGGLLVGGILEKLVFKNGGYEFAGEEGGGLQVLLGSFQVLDCIFELNQASGSGALYELGECTNAYTKTSFLGNSAVLTSGGAVGMHWDPLAQASPMSQFRNCDFVGNTASIPFGEPTGGGGAVAVCPSQASQPCNARPFFYACTFQGNRVVAYDDVLSERNGGAIYAREVERMSVAHCVFEDNQAPWRGGALFFASSGDITIDYNEFISNQTCRYGGAVATEEVEHLRMKQNLFHSNMAGHMLIDDQCTQNMDELEGGGVHLETGTGGILEFNRFVDNRLDDRLLGETALRGGALYHRADPFYEPPYMLQTVRTTFRANGYLSTQDPPTSVGAVYLNGAIGGNEGTFRQNIITETFGDDPSPDPSFFCNGVWSGASDFSCNAFFNNYGGDVGDEDNCLTFDEPFCEHGNFAGLDPQLCGDDVTDCWLRSDSPCREGNHPNQCSCGTIGARGKPGNEDDLTDCGYDPATVEREVPSAAAPAFKFGNLVGNGRIQMLLQHSIPLIKWSLVDVAGRQVGAGMIPGRPGRNTLDLTTQAGTIASGVYFLRVRAADTVQRVRLVVIK